MNDIHHLPPSIGPVVYSSSPASPFSGSAPTKVHETHLQPSSIDPIVDSSAPAGPSYGSALPEVHETHLQLPSTGLIVDSSAPAGVSSGSELPEAKKSHRQHPITGPIVDSSETAGPSSDSALPGVHEAQHQPLSTRREDGSAASADHFSTSIVSAVDDTFCNFPSTGPEVDEAAAADRLSTSILSVVDDACCHLLSTGIEVNSAAPASILSDSALTEDNEAHRHHLPSTGPGVHSKAPANDSSSENNKLTNTQKRRQRRKAKKLLKKSVMDFISDEEQEDFSADSSDVWSGNDTASCSSSDNEPKKGRKKKKNIKKTKVTPTEILREDATTIKKREKRINLHKINKKLKDEGKEYVTRKGKTIEAKSMKENPCLPGICKRGCFEITEVRRRAIFDFYWSLDVRRRSDWLIRCAKVGSVRRKRKKDSEKRNATVDYYINDGEDHKKVCQKFILSTLDITQRHLNYVLTNVNEGMSLKDSRTRIASNKYSESAKENVRKFIESLPACPSHYNRKKSKRMYLSQDLRNLSNLFRIYETNCKKNDEEIVSEAIFRKIFNEEYDLGFHTPKKDKCVMCTKAENSANEMSEDEKNALKKHVDEKEASYRRFKAHQTLKDAKTVCCSFDLQKVLNTPFGESMLLYYSRKYAVLNFTVYESITQEVYCFTWGECDGKRGSNEMATCLYLYLQELDKKGFETALLYCDSCTGQNKNRVVLSVLNYFLLKSENLQVIQINYLLPGHTYMPADSVHATIESEVKKIIVWSPTQWASYFETARKKPKPYNVNVLEHTQFINWEDLATKTFTKETCKKVKFKNIRIATFKKKNLNKMDIKYSMNEDAVSEKVTLFEKDGLKGKGKGKGKNKKKKEVSHEQETDYLHEMNAIVLQPCYREKLPIPEVKYKDLKKLCSDGTIPKRFHRDYLELPYCKKNDCLNETDEEDVICDDDSNE